MGFDSMSKIAVLLTVHNRKSKTLSALRALYDQAGLPANVVISVYLVDDGSSDGTSVAILQNFPQVTLFQGTGNLYWNGGMRLAYEKAAQDGFHDFYLWLNDDTTLYLESLRKLLDISASFGDKAIVAASMQDPETGLLTYGGVRRLKRWRPLKFSMVAPEDTPVPIDTMNGNCVLIPQSIAKRVGNLDPAFMHAIGDFDYGLRARKLGVEIYLAPGYYGNCKTNLPDDKRAGLVVRMKKFISPLGLPPHDWVIFAQRHGGPFWTIYFLWPYIRRLIGK